MQDAGRRDVDAVGAAVEVAVLGAGRGGAGIAQVRVGRRVAGVDTEIGGEVVRAGGDVVDDGVRYLSEEY